MMMSLLCFGHFPNFDATEEFRVVEIRDDTRTVLENVGDIDGLKTYLTDEEYDGVVLRLGSTDLIISENDAESTGTNILKIASFARKHVKKVYVCEPYISVFQEAVNQKLRMCEKFIPVNISSKASEKRGDLLTANLMFYFNHGRGDRGKIRKAPRRVKFDLGGSSSQPT